MTPTTQEPMVQPPPTNESGSRTSLSPRLIAFGVMFTLVIVSALGGAALDRLLSHRPMSGGKIPGLAPEGRGGGPGGRGGPGSRGGARFMDERLTGDLALTPAQRVAVDSAMQKQFRDFEAARSSVQPRLDSILNATRQAVEEILTPAQRAALPPGPTLDGPGFGNRRDGRGGSRGRAGSFGPRDPRGPPPSRDGGGNVPLPNRLPHP